MSAELRYFEDTAAIERVLATAVGRMHAAFGALTIPEKQLSVTYASRTIREPDSARAYKEAHPYVMVYLQRHSAPLVANRLPSGLLPACKIIAVPIVYRLDQPVGVIAFCKSVSLPDFSSRELHIAQRIARMIEVLLDRLQRPASGWMTRAVLQEDRGRNQAHPGAADCLGEEQLRAALDNDRLQTFAQRVAPLRDLARTSDIECLARLIAEDGSIVPAREFLPAAARCQLLTTIDQRMIERTLTALRRHTATLLNREIQVAFNISEPSLCDDDFLRFVESCLRKSDLPTLITFEIAESVAARNLARTDLVMRRLRKLGCSIALDDFGTRLVSLALLQSLRPDRVKIEGGLVRTLFGSPESEAIIRTIVKTAEALYIECVAKHVESERLANKLRELGVVYAQGNYLHEAESLSALFEPPDLQA